MNLEKEDPEQKAKNAKLEKIQIKRLKELKKAQNEKIRLKDPKEIKEFLETRKGFMSERKVRGSGGEIVNYNNLSPTDRKKAFVDGLFQLQEDQNKIQKVYAEKV